MQLKTPHTIVWINYFCCHKFHEFIWCQYNLVFLTIVDIQRQKASRVSSADFFPYVWIIYLVLHENKMQRRLNIHENKLEKLKLKPQMLMLNRNSQTIVVNLHKIIKEKNGSALLCITGKLVKKCFNLQWKLLECE